MQAAFVQFRRKWRELDAVDACNTRSRSVHGRRRRRLAVRKETFVFALQRVSDRCRGWLSVHPRGRRQLAASGEKIAELEAERANDVARVASSQAIHEDSSVARFLDAETRRAILVRRAACGPSAARFLPHVLKSRKDFVYRFFKCSRSVQFHLGARRQASLFILKGGVWRRERRQPAAHILAKGAAWSQRSALRFADRSDMTTRRSTSSLRFASRTKCRDDSIFDRHAARFFRNLGRFHGSKIK